MSPEVPSLGSAVHGPQTNARLGWALTAVVAVAGVGTLLAGGVAWGTLWLALAVALALPAAVSREWTLIVPWLLPLSAVVAVVLRTTGGFPETAGYVAVTTLALVVVVELDRFTRVDMSRYFTVGFAVMTTLALQAVWTVVQFASDRWLDTEFLRSQTELQVDFVVVTVVALVVGGLFVRYLDHAAPTDQRIVPEARR